MRGRQRQRLAAAKCVEVPKTILLCCRVIFLVYYQENGLSSLANNARNLFIFIGNASRAINHKDNNVCFFTRKKRLLTNVWSKAILGFDRFNTAGINELKLTTIPVSVMIRTVTGYSPGLVHNCIAFLGNSIYQRGLTNIRASNNSNNGLSHVSPFIQLV